MKKWIGVVALCGLSLTGCDNSVMGKISGSSKDAQALYMRVAGADLDAMRELVAKADQGDPYAALQAGYILHTGTGGMEVNYAKAADFYLKAARLPTANYNLALLLVNKQVVPGNGKPASGEAISRLQTAAERATDKFVHPLVSLAQIYEKGIGVPANPEIASIWYEKAAAMNDPLAMYKIGMAYLNGNGRPANPHLAEKWLMNAAERWNIDAQLQLGLLMSDANYQGYKPVHAAQWFYIASLSRTEYRQVMEEYFSSLSEKEQGIARRLAESWMKGHQQMPNTPGYNKPTNMTL